MKAAILYKNDLKIDIKEHVSELFRQLSPNKIQLDLAELLNEKNQITVAYCEDNNKIIGIASMFTYKVISGNKGWIEDVVVDSASRGKGIGRKLINLLVKVGEEKELSEREIANGNRTNQERIKSYTEEIIKLKQYISNNEQYLKEKGKHSNR